MIGATNGKDKDPVHVIWSIHRWTNKITIYCVVRKEENAEEALKRVTEHWLDKDEQFFSSPTLFFS